MSTHAINQNEFKIDFTFKCKLKCKFISKIKYRRKILQLWDEQISLRLNIYEEKDKLDFI